MAEWHITIGQITKTASTTVEAPTQAAAEEKAMNRVGDTTKYTVVMETEKVSD